MNFSGFLHRLGGLCGLGFQPSRLHKGGVVLSQLGILAAILYANRRNETMRYEFDRLGWLNFEWLVQTWLKAEFGFTVESWGGNHDQGRDAYSKETVSSRSTKSEYPGSVVFQAKFVEQANAAGSDYKSPLIRACVAEAMEPLRRFVILQRGGDRRSFFSFCCGLQGNAARFSSSL